MPMTARIRGFAIAAASMAIFGSMALSGCIPPAPEPTPAPSPASAPAPAPPPPPPPASPPPANWMDAPQTPGDWSYSGGAASFGNAGTAQLVLRCDRATRQVEITRTGAGPSVTSLRILTETQVQAVNAAQGTARLAASDQLLDAMAFSKGRFAVEAAGMPTLYAPAWPEVTRVIEDCR